MKHVKLFEEFGLQKNPNFSPEDKIQSGDTAFCWNFEDGWMVTLLGEKLSTEMMDHLEASLRNLVDEPRYSSKKGIAFVSTGIPSELSVSFEMENFDTSKFDYLVNSQGETENLADEYSGSCVFTLKRNHVIGHRWNGGQFCIPIEEYFEKYADKADEFDDDQMTTIELSNGYSLTGPASNEAEALAIVEEMEKEMKKAFDQAMRNGGESAAMDARDDVYFDEAFKEALSELGFEMD